MVRNSVYMTGYWLVGITFAWTGRFFFHDVLNWTSNGMGIALGLGIYWLLGAVVSDSYEDEYEFEDEKEQDDGLVAVGMTDNNDGSKFMMVFTADGLLDSKARNELKEYFKDVTIDEIYQANLSMDGKKLGKIKKVWLDD